MKLTESEWQIMNALWKRHPATAREIRESLAGNVTWAHTTVKTLLSRLREKNAVSEHKSGNASVYEPLISRKKARLSELTLLLDRAFDGGIEPLLHFLVEEKKLSKRERLHLLNYLRDQEMKGEKDNESNP